MVQDIYDIPRTFGNKPDELCLLEKCCGTFIVHMVGSLVTYEKYYSIGADVFVKTLVGGGTTVVTKKFWCREVDETLTNLQIQPTTYLNQPNQLCSPYFYANAYRNTFRHTFSL